MLIFEVLIGMCVVFLGYAAIDAFRGQAGAGTIQDERPSLASATSSFDDDLDPDAAALPQPASSRELRVPSATR